MTLDADFIISAAVCILGLTLVAAYFYMQQQPSSICPWWERLDTPQGILRRRTRRHLGMALMALVCIALFCGVNFMEPLPAPLTYALYWLIVVLLLVWICLLALSDVRHTLKLHRRWSAERQHADLESLLQQRQRAQSLRIEE